MQFLEKNTPISLSEIITRFPYIREVIEISHSLDINFEVDGNRIMLMSPYSNSVCTNIDGELDYHKKFFFKNSIYKQPLGKALGLKRGEKKPHVFDVTAGMLGDSLLMHSFGCRVSAWERHPAAFILSANAIFNSSVDIDLTFGNAVDLHVNAYKECDVIYFDPMYGGKNDKALPKKEMRIFREIVGVDSDAKVVAEKLKSKNKRLVVKRSIKTSPLMDNPCITFLGKSTAYDVYK